MRHPEGQTSGEDKKGVAFVTVKSLYVRVPFLENLFDRFRVAIPSANPNDLGWIPKQ
jgi:hypothetical protein